MKSGSHDAFAGAAARSDRFLASINNAISDANKESKELARKDATGARAPVAKPKKAQEGPSPFTDDEIVEKAKRLAEQYKGSPWSYTEYNSVLYPTLDHLRQQGVPERQITLFKKTCDDHPGRPFNPWSGD